MAQVEKISVALTSEMVAAAREATEAGEYASASEVLRDAMREWMRRRLERTRAITELGRLWDEGLASGPPADGEEAFARLRERLEKRLASREA